jgi:hypothetical protein
MTTRTATVRILRAARRKIEKGWCQRVMARDEFGRPSLASSKESTMFCAVGAIYSAQRRRTTSRDRAIFLLDDAVRAFTRGRHDDIVQFNDSRDRRKIQILAVYDRAIKMAKEKDL